MPPQVQDLNTLIGQYQTALAPQKAAIDTQIKANDTSGQQQEQGLDAKKVQAFGDITQQANDRGGYFSGFSPDAQAKYTSATYLPALAQLQSTIAGTRATLLGKEADLSASANTSALTRQQQEQSDLTAFQEEQAKEAAAAAAAERQNAFTASENAKDRAATLSAANAKASQITPAQQQAADFAAANNDLSHSTGKDGKVSPQTYRSSKQNWVNAGYSAGSFDTNFGNYINQSHAQDYK